MGSGFDAEYFPEADSEAYYTIRYPYYQSLGNYIEQYTHTRLAGS